MNPGLLNEALTLRRKSQTKDELGQPVDSWADAGVFRGRRKRSKAKAESMVSDSLTEAQEAIFMARSRPFVSIYQEGDELRAAERMSMPEEIWLIQGWSEVEGTNGEFVEISVARFA